MQLSQRTRPFLRQLDNHPLPSSTRHPPSTMASDREATPEIGYSRDETVAAVRDLVDLATSMYLDEAAYESPPGTGWPSITPESMGFFAKTDNVVDLLRHLPYPSDEDPDRRPQLMPNLPFAAFQQDDFGQSAETLRLATEGTIWEHVPPHVVGLAVRPRDDHGVLLDTNLGVVFWLDAATEFKWLSPFPTLLGLDGSDEDSDGEDAMSPGERAWRECDMVWSIPNFFAMLKHHLKELNFVPMSPRRVVDGFHDDDEAVDMVKGIYREHGWPDLERYRKEDCLKAIHAALSENFPDEVEDEDWEGLVEAADE